MSRIQIVTDNAALRKLLELLVEKMETVPSGIVLLDAADMARLPEFPKEKTVLFTASADPFCLDDARKTEAAAFWYLQPSVEALEEVLTAVTLNGAAAIDMADKVGSIEPGKQGDLVIWDAPDLNYICYRFGSNLVKSVIKAGKVVK